MNQLTPEQQELLSGIKKRLHKRLVKREPYLDGAIARLKRPNSNPSALDDLLLMNQLLNSLLNKETQNG